MFGSLDGVCTEKCLANMRDSFLETTDLTYELGREARYSLTYIFSESLWHGIDTSMAKAQIHPFTNLF